MDDFLLAATGGRVDPDRLLSMLHEVPQEDISDPSLAAACDLFNKWLKGANFKHTLVALQCLHYLTELLDEQMKHHLSTFMPAMLERLGDTKDQIRELAVGVVLSLMEHAGPVQAVFDFLVVGLKHRNPKVKVHLLSIIDAVLDRFGPSSLSISKIMMDVCALLSDPNEQVRESANTTIVEIYRHVGERFRIDIEKKEAIPSSKRIGLFQQFDALHELGAVLAREDDALASVKASSSTTKAPPSLSSIAKKSSDPLIHETSNINQRTRASTFALGSTSPQKSLGTKDGGLDEEAYNEAVRSSSSIDISHPSDIEREFNAMAPAIADERHTDWEKRVAHLIRLRKLTAGNASSYDCFLTDLRVLREPLCIGIRDLRSQVSREATITVSKLAEVFCDRLEPFIDYFVPELLKQVVINVKVIADSSHLCLRWIVSCVHSKTLIARLIESGDAKSVTLRRRVIEYMNQALHEWEVSHFNKTSNAVQKYILKALNDADSYVRVTARKAFWGFDVLFHDLAQSIFAQLDAPKQKLLMEEKDKGTTVSSKISSSSSLSLSKSNISSRPSVTSTTAPTTTTTTTTSRPPTGMTTCYSNLQRKPASSLAIPLTKKPQKIDDDFPDNISDISLSSNHSLNGASTSLSASTTMTSTTTTSTTSRNKASPNKIDPLNMSHPPITPNARIAASSLGFQSRKPASTIFTSELKQPQRVTQPIKQPAPSSSTRTESTITSGARRVVKETTLGPSTTTSTTSLSRSANGSLKQQSTLTTVRKTSSPPKIASSVILSPTQKQSQQSLQIDPIDHIISTTMSHHPNSRLEAVLTVMTDTKSLSEYGVAKLQSLFINEFDSANQISFSHVAESLHTFIGRYPGSLHFSMKLLTILISKMVIFDVPLVTVPKMEALFDLIRHTHDRQQQLINLIEIVTDPNLQQPKEIVLILDFIVKLVSILIESNFSFVFRENEQNFITFITKLTIFATDTMNTDVARISTKLIIELFLLNSPLFADIFSHLPFTPANTIRMILDEHVSDWSSRTKSSSSSLPSPSQSRPSTSGTVSPRHSMSPRLSQSRIPIPSSPPSRRATAQVLQSSNTLTLIDRDGSAESSSDFHIPTSIPVDYHASTYAKSDADLITSQNDEFASSSEFRAAVDSLSQDNQTAVQSTEETLLWLLKVVKERNSHVWASQFDSVIDTVLSLLSDPDPNIRDLATRLLRDIIKYQFSHIGSRDADIFNHIIERHKDSSSIVLRAADEALTSFATSLAPMRCVSLIQPILDNEQSVVVLLPALKALSKIIKKLSVSELEEIGSNLVVGLFKGYRHSAAEVRKAVVFSLVELHLQAAHVLSPHLSTLSGSQLKLLQIYIKKAEERLSGASASPSQINSTV